MHKPAKRGRKKKSAPDVSTTTCTNQYERVYATSGANRRNRRHARAEATAEIQPATDKPSENEDAEVNRRSNRLRDQNKE